MLYSKSANITLTEIAQKVGVHVNTVGRWKVKFKWDEYSESMLTTRAEQLRRLYMQLKELNDHIFDKPEGQRFANKAEADTLIQITRSIGNLEKDMTAADVINVMIPFVQFVAKTDSNKAKEFIEYQDRYIKQML